MSFSYEIFKGKMLDSVNMGWFIVVACLLGSYTNYMRKLIDLKISKIMNHILSIKGICSKSYLNIWKNIYE